MLGRLIAFEAVALAVIQPEQPRPDMFLLLDGAPRKRLAAWCQEGFRSDPLLQEVVCCQTTRTAPGDGLLRGHGIAAARSAAPLHNTWWWLAMARRQPFTESEQQLVDTLLRTLAARFEFPFESQLGRVLLGGDYQLRHMDPLTALRCLQSPDVLTELQTTLPQVIEQRWPSIADHEPHDVFISLARQPTWVRCCRGRADDLHSRYWCLQLRQLERDDPPAVGLVEDRRVAQAMGYLTDRYRESPSLAKLADAVATSPFHFHRLFSRQVGVSPKHFLLRTQLMHAKQMLRATRMPIGEVAATAGFSSHGHFTATFNRMVGVNPSDYREQA